MWDHYVFDRDVTHLNPKSDNHGSGESNKNESHWMAEEEFLHQSDQNRKDKRPFFKVLLLTGPPGTGKVLLIYHFLVSLKIDNSRTYCCEPLRLSSNRNECFR
jgi:SpoVK/Ycf46/Vps4 family AAA+-type ATPase